MVVLCVLHQFDGIDFLFFQVLAGEQADLIVIVVELVVRQRRLPDPRNAILLDLQPVFDQRGLDQILRLVLFIFDHDVVPVEVAQFLVGLWALRVLRGLIVALGVVQARVLETAGHNAGALAPGDAALQGGLVLLLTVRHDLALGIK